MCMTCWKFTGDCNYVTYFRQFGSNEQHFLFLKFYQRFHHHKKKKKIYNSNYWRKRKRIIEVMVTARPKGKYLHKSIRLQTPDCILITFCRDKAIKKILILTIYLFFANSSTDILYAQIYNRI